MTSPEADPAPAASPAGRVLRLGTRGSALALVQSRAVGAALADAGVAVEIEIIRTAGDDQAPDTAWGEGAFVGALERALLDGSVDLAVHSSKDVPTTEDPRLVIAAFCRREDPRDALVCRERGLTLATLPHGARVGTDSPRRTAFLLERRPDLRLHPLNGNVDTRLRRLDAGESDALVLAVAGLTRLGRADRIDERLDIDVVVPAPGRVRSRSRSARTTRWRATSWRGSTTGRRAPPSRPSAPSSTPPAAAAARRSARYAHVEGDEIVIRAAVAREPVDPADPVRRPRRGARPARGAPRDRRGSRRAAPSDARHRRPGRRAPAVRPRDARPVPGRGARRRARRARASTRSPCPRSTLADAAPGPLDAVARDLAAIRLGRRDERQRRRRPRRGVRTRGHGPGHRTLGRRRTRDGRGAPAPRRHAVVRPDAHVRRRDRRGAAAPRRRSRAPRTRGHRRRSPARRAPGGRRQCRVGRRIPHRGGARGIPRPARRCPALRRDRRLRLHERVHGPRAPRARAGGRPPGRPRHPGVLHRRLDRRRRTRRRVRHTSSPPARRPPTGSPTRSPTSSSPPPRHVRRRRTREPPDEPRTRPARHRRPVRPPAAASPSVPPDGRPARARPRDAPGPVHARGGALRPSRHRAPRGDRLHAGRLPPEPRPRRRGGEAARVARRGRPHPLRAAGREGRRGDRAPGSATGSSRRRSGGCATRARGSSSSPTRASASTRTTATAARSRRTGASRTTSRSRCSPRPPSPRPPPAPTSWRRAR